MCEAEYDVLAIGNAIVDIISREDERFLADHGIAKGSMSLIDMHRAETLYAAMGPATETSGGSAANTVAGIASFGGRTAFIGKVADDHLGEVFAHDIKATGTRYHTPHLESGDVTARCMIVVTPDGERSMSTYLGACAKLAPDDMDADLIRQSKITYFEGYLWDPPEAKSAIRAAARIAHDAGRQVAMTLSDAFCVDRYREEFLELMTSGTVDIVFANEAEAKSLYQTSDLTTAVNAMREDAPLSIITRGKQGAIVITRERTGEMDAMPADKVVDTTGAGDLFAAGFLYGLTDGRELQNCARLGAMAAWEVITHIGARPSMSLAELATQNGY